jgi:hypothetical protein
MIIRRNHSYIYYLLTQLFFYREVLILIFFNENEKILSMF